MRDNIKYKQKKHTCISVQTGQPTFESCEIKKENGSKERKKE